MRTLVSMQICLGGSVFVILKNAPLAISIRIIIPESYIPS